VIATYQPEAVMHFAALSSVGEGEQFPEVYYDVNVGGSLKTLQAAKDVGVSRIVFSSTAAVYGHPGELPIVESAPTLPVNVYGRSKLCAENVIADICRAYGLRAVILRYFNAAGADGDNEIGEDHRPETHLVPRVLMAASGDIGALTVNGNDYDTRDGTALRDYVHVCDLARAHVDALDMHLSAEAPVAVYNLGSQRGATVHEIISTAEMCTGTNVPFEIGPRRRGDPSALIADSRCAQRDFGWTARDSDLRTIIASAWKWHRQKTRSPEFR
jgi:UDP-glucose-4-epimerase GalE